MKEYGFTVKELEIAQTGLSQIPCVHYKGMYEFAELNVKISHTPLMFGHSVLPFSSGVENPCVSKSLQLLTLHSNSFKSALLWWHPSSQGCCEELLCGPEWGRTLFTGILQSLADHERRISSINIVLCAVLCSFSYLKPWFYLSELSVILLCCCRNDESYKLFKLLSSLGSQQFWVQNYFSNSFTDSCHY